MWLILNHALHCVAFEIRLIVCISIRNLCNIPHRLHIKNSFNQLNPKFQIMQLLDPTLEEF